MCTYMFLLSATTLLQNIHQNYLNVKHRNAAFLRHEPKFHHPHCTQLQRCNGVVRDACVLLIRGLIWRCSSITANHGPWNSYGIRCANGCGVYRLGGLFWTSWGCKLYRIVGKNVMEMKLKCNTMNMSLRTSYVLFGTSEQFSVM
jgi:hypothetical protein